jgi:hypothetical protein
MPIPRAYLGKKLKISFSSFGLRRPFGSGGSSKEGGRARPLLGHARPIRRSFPSICVYLYNIIIYYSIYLYKERFKELLKKDFPYNPRSFGNMGVDFIHNPNL